MLNKDFVRDGSRRIIGSVTTGYSDTSSTIRDEHNGITGRTNDRFHTTATPTGRSSQPTPLIRVC
jgi:hypothetical protein